MIQVQVLSLFKTWGFQLQPKSEVTIDVNPYKDTSLYWSCSLTFKNEFYVFGSQFEHRQQVSKIVGCQVKRVGDLDFNFTAGACTNVNDETVHLCFNDNFGDHKKCRFADYPEGKFSEAESSRYPHRYINIASSKSKSRELIKFNPFSRNTGYRIS